MGIRSGVTTTGSDGGSSIVGPSAPTGTTINITGGVGDSGDGGDVVLTTGTGSGDPGAMSFITGAFASDVGFDWFWGGNNILRLVSTSSPPTNGSAAGLFIPIAADFTIGHLDLGSGEGKSLTIVAQTSGDDAGGPLNLFGGGGDSEGGPATLTGGAGANGSGADAGVVGGTGSGGSGGSVFSDAASGGATDSGGGARLKAAAGGATSGDDGDVNLALTHGSGSGARGVINYTVTGTSFQKTSTATVSTANSTPVTILTVPTTTNNSVTLIDLKVVAIDATANETATWKIAVTIQRTDGIAAVTVDNEDFFHVFKTDVSWDVTTSVSGQSVNIQVTGDATNSTAFRVIAEVTEHS